MAELVLDARSPIPGKLDDFLYTGVARLLAEIEAAGFDIECEEIGRIDATPCESRIITACPVAA